MRLHPAFTFALCLAAAGLAGAARAATWATIDIGPYSNWRLQDQAGLTTVATGVSNFAGVPFLLDASGNNSWNGNLATGQNPRVLDIPVTARSVSSVRLLLNSIWGQPSGTYLTVAVTDSFGNVDSLQLTGNQHLRDYNSGPWTSTINGTTTITGWTDGTCTTNGKRLDVFTLTLPPTWTNRLLTHVRVLDYGASSFQRACVSGLTLETADSLAHVPLDMKSVCNFAWRGNSTMLASPTGIFDVAGEPFVLPASGNDCWDANLMGAGTWSITLPAKLWGARSVHTLINTLFGQPGPASYAMVSLFFSGAQRYDVPLVGDVDVRDYNVNSWTNTINGTTTQSVWNNGECAYNVGHRLDMQTITVPALFRSARLDSVRFTDTGADNFQRMVLHGVTVDTGTGPALAGVDAMPPAAEPALRIEPSPARGAFRVRFAAASLAVARTVDVADVRGRRVGRPLVLAAGARELAIDGGTLGTRLAPGIYFVSVRGGDPALRARVVVLH